MSLTSSSVVVLVVDQLDVGLDEPERDPPVAVDPDRPVVGKVTLEWVRSKRRDREIPIAVGLAVNQEMTGLFVGIGAFIVANADLGDSFGQRGRLMIPTTLAVAALTGLGMATGLSQWLGVAVGASPITGCGRAPS
jgi:hypothetical protein